MRDPAQDLPIRFADVTVRAGSITLLDGVSLAITPGRSTVVIGPNGAGKTTFLRAAMGLIVPAGGRISWAGRVDSPPAQRAIMFQRPVMLRRSVVANLRYALAAVGTPRAEREPRAADLISLVGLCGYENRPARRLSGGEQQRLSLARALARNPSVLFLDEPTASLDPAATQSIEDIVRAVSARGVKVVMATHDLGEARRLAGQIVLLHRGRLIESGPAEAFFAAPTTEQARKFVAGELLV